MSSRKKVKRNTPIEDRAGIRKETCGGCWRDCRRADVARCPVTYIEAKMGLEDAVTSGDRIGSKAFITPNTVLGRMHELKEQDWSRYLASCDKYGETLPTTPADLLEWAVALRPLQVRLALGVDREIALGMKTALKVTELAAYYKLKVTEVPSPLEPEVTELLSPAQEEDGDLPF